MDPMGMVHLPPFIWKMYGFHVGKYTIVPWIRYGVSRDHVVFPQKLPLKHWLYPVGGWTTHLKNMLVKLEIFPNFGVNINIIETTT